MVHSTTEKESTAAAVRKQSSVAPSPTIVVIAVASIAIAGTENEIAVDSAEIDGIGSTDRKKVVGGSTGLRDEEGVLSMMRGTARLVAGMEDSLRMMDLDSVMGNTDSAEAGDRDCMVVDTVDTIAEGSNSTAASDKLKPGAADNSDTVVDSSPADSRTPSLSPSPSLSHSHCHRTIHHSHSTCPSNSNR